MSERELPVLAWMKRARGLVERRGYGAALGAILALGVYLRVNGWLFRGISFWYDEALWATRLLHWPLKQLGIRPLGFMWLSRLIVNTFGVTDVWFRLLPALGAVASLLLFPYVVSRLVAAKPLRLLAVFLFATNPALVDYANEFKPYSFEVLVHVLPIALYLRFRETGARCWLVALLAYLPCGFLMAYNLAFAFPGLLLLCLFGSWRSEERKSRVAATLLAGVVCATLAGFVYDFSLRGVTREKKTESYWGGKYHVFYEKRSPQSRVSWTLEKYDDMTAMVGLRRNLWSPYGGLDEARAERLGSADRALWIGLSFAGLIALALHRRDLLLLLFVPLIVVVLANYAGKWPLGSFRTNLFVIPYVLLLAISGFQFLASPSLHLPTAKYRVALLAGLVTCLTLLPGFWFGFDWHGHKRTFTRDFYQREIFELLTARRQEQLRQDPGQKPVALLMEPHSYNPYRFYVTEVPETKAKYADFFERSFRTEKVEIKVMTRDLRKRLRRERRGMWIVCSSLRHAELIERAARRDAKVVVSDHIADQHFIMFLKPKGGE